MDRRGANTFPFYTLPPVLRNISKKEFFCAFFLSLLDKIKFGGDSCLPRHFAKINANQHSKNSQFSPPYHRTSDSAGLLLFNTGLRFAFAKCRGKQESPPNFISSNRKGKKYRKNPFSRYSEYGG